MHIASNITSGDSLASTPLCAGCIALYFEQESKPQSIHEIHENINFIFRRTRLR